MKNINNLVAVSLRQLNSQDVSYHFTTRLNE
jgi:hypothetical protein